MKKTMYELLGMVKDESDKTNINIYVKYFDRLKERDDIMLACKENIIYKLDNLNIELNDEVEILEESKEIPKKLDWNKNDFTYPEGNLMSEETADMLMEMQDKINEILDYLESKGE